MKKRNHSQVGFTLTELLVTIGIISILASLLLPALARAKARGIRIKCVNNVGQIGKALLSFATDNNDRLPWQLTPIRKDYHFGGKYVEDLGSIFSTAAMKSELQTAKILWSPCDAEREAANEDAMKGWSGYNAKTGNLISNSAISYVLIKGADTGRPSTILSATRNLTTCDLATAKWAGADENPIPDHAMAGLNKSQGQIVLADGSAKQSTDADLGSSGKIVKGHINSSGGVTLGKASTAVIGCGGGGDGGGGGGHLTLIAVQAGSTVAIDDLKIVCLTSGKVFYQNNFNAGDLTGLQLQHSHDPKHNRIVNGRLMLKAAGDYEAYGRMHLKDDLPKDYELSFVVNKLQWPGHFEFMIYEDPSERHIPIALKGLSFYTNINGSKINHVTTWARPPNPEPLGWKPTKKTLYGFHRGWSGAYQGKDVHYKLRVNQGKLTLWVQGQRLASN